MTLFELTVNLGKILLFIIVALALIFAITFLLSIIVNVIRYFVGGDKMAEEKKKVYTLDEIEKAYESASLIMDNKIKELLGEDESKWDSIDAACYGASCDAIIAHWKLMEDILKGDDENGKE